MSPQEENDRVALTDFRYLARRLLDNTPKMTTVVGKHYIAKFKKFVVEIEKELRDDRLPRFTNVYCSQCGADFGPGDHGYSHCEKHRGRR